MDSFRETGCVLPQPGKELYCPNALVKKWLQCPENIHEFGDVLGIEDLESLLESCAS